LPIHRKDARTLSPRCWRSWERLGAYGMPSREEQQISF
jgi:hypothetical protein